MDNISIVNTILDKLAALAWPLLALYLAIRFSNPIQNIVLSAGKRKFSIKVGGTELTMDEITEQQGRSINDLQEQVVNLQRTVEELKAGKSKIRLSLLGKENTVIKNILWVDDYPSNNASFISHLSDLGVTVATALSTKEGLFKLSKFSFDAIISDMGRTEDGKSNPRAGIDLAVSVREIDKKIPFLIYCSSIGQARGEKDALKAGVNGVTSSGVQLLNMLRNFGYLGKP
jgi:CheY-like chemotaxis protein